MIIRQVAQMKRDSCRGRVGASLHNTWPEGTQREKCTAPEGEGGRVKCGANGPAAPKFMGWALHRANLQRLL